MSCHVNTRTAAHFQAMIHCGAIRQTASIVGMDRDHLRTGDKTVARFRFVRYPEYLRPGLRLVFREGRTKAVGLVAAIYPDGAAVP
jgi:GTPase